ncbi:HAD-SF-IA-v1: HAD hydrolase, family IA, variant 1 [Gaiella occulta]|uniref:HAD-SF-IA-v1: HAD hydrolase, family IA, variant 1 n=1 Tax=Gaiella occulta TaxID=1002870 RepID=A0A7M2YZR8_9ACTN|nr:HAD family hydrolase [Gaiella occulta]RDI75011.1 HAD-SF-IA-v1: HAD hydrolase, family IA, variant 1 [Gaiella occulta]
MIRAVLFDWGNTLAAWEYDHELLVEGHRRGLEAFGRGAPGREAFTRAYEERLLPELLAPRELEVDYGQAVADLLADAGAAGIESASVARFLAAEQRVWRPAHRLEASVPALLDALRARGLRVGLVSNLFDPPALVRDLLGEMGLLERLDAVALSAEVGRRKPHAAIFERALADLGVEPEEAVMVGDRLREDVGGAQALGLRTIQALWFAADDEGELEPDAQAFTPSDVLRLVERWRREA